MDAQTRTSLLAEARSWIGTPYHHKARIKGVGVDCGGLLYEVYSPYFTFPPYPTNYAPDWTLHRENEIYLDFMTPYAVEVSDPVMGGVAVFRAGRNFGHGGIVTEKGTIIHAYGRNGFGAVIESNMAFFRKWPRKYFDVNQ